MGSLGETLAEERRRRGKTIADVEAATRIRGRLLEALENGRYEQLPSSAYVKGYIQSYAQFLELPVKPLLDEYASERRLTPESHFEERGQLDLPADPVVPKRENAHEMPMKTWAIILAVIVVGLLATWGVASLLRPKTDLVPAAPLTAADTTKPKRKTPAQKPKKTVKSTTAVETSSPATTDTNGGSTSNSANKGSTFTLRISVEDGQASWVKITVDGLTAYEGTLEGANPKEYQVADSAKVRIGRPSVVTVTRDGQPVEVKDEGNVGTVSLTTNGE